MKIEECDNEITSQWVYDEVNGVVLFVVGYSAACWRSIYSKIDAGVFLCFSLYLIQPSIKPDGTVR
jgi:hypothetical protein